MLLDDAFDHVPAGKRRHLRRAVKILFEEFEEAQKGRLSDKAKRGRILKLILYGSYARGTWRDDPATGFYSDFDILVVVNYEHFAEEYDAWDWVRERLTLENSLADFRRPYPSLIVHSYADVNGQLARGRPFFADIVREGIVLYEVPGYPLSEIGPFTEEMRHEEQWVHFDRWYPDAESFMIAAKTLVEHGRLNKAAFLVHQSAENLYHCAMLVLVLYSPKLHALRELRRRAEKIEIRLAEAWPRNTRFSRRCFNLLHDAYVKARYSYRYTITAEELSWLIERVEVLNRLVGEICRERLGERPAAPSE